MPQPNQALASRLRRLREEAENRLTQSQVARALGVSIATVSSDETSARSIPLSRLSAYASFYATVRAGGADALRGESIDDHAVPDQEYETRLLAELTHLHGRSGGGAEDVAGASTTWRFADGPVRLVCGEIPAGPERSSLASPSASNYTELFSYADADALVELFGHIRAQNPRLDVRFKTSANLDSDDLSGHLVLLGGLGWNQATSWFAQQYQSSFPVRQVDVPTFAGGDLFEIRKDGEWQRVLPKFADESESDLVEDLGLLIRIPNPYNQGRSMTMCNGIFSRGVLGAVRCLTDARLRASNEGYISRRFGGAKEFGILMRVSVFNGQVVTPDLTNPTTPLLEWPERS
jgi:transcriptional regulator with XRE-family HTH domain